MRPVRHHSILDVPLTHPAGSSIPLLCIEGDGGQTYISRTAYLFARALQRRGFSPDKIGKFVHALGLLSDFARARSARPVPQSEAGAQNLLESFAEARLAGTIDLSGGDPLGLYWEPVSLTTANYDCTLLSEFGEWLAANASYEPHPRWEARFIRRVIHDYAISKRLAHSMFLHLKRTVTGRDDGEKPTVWKFARVDQGRRGIGKRSDVPVSFPPEKVLPLIHSAENLRDKLLFTLLAFGGIRGSEALHLFVQDVMGVDSRGCAIIRLAHPEDALTEWVHRGVQKRGSRAVFLRDRYGIAPRNRLAKGHPLRLGWKGMVLDRTGNTTVQWLSVDAGRLFWQIHVEYMRSARLNAGDSHPYYFINTSPKHFGTPMKQNNLDNQFYQACSRIGLNAGEVGSHPHGLRHFYGYMLANVLRVPPEVAQEAFHHSRLDSTMVYYRLTPATVNASLDEAILASSTKLEAQSGGKFSEILGNMERHGSRLPTRYGR